jgi:Leucine-rich repeat (LRR) protein
MFRAVLLSLTSAALVSAAPETASDFEAWVESQNGVVERDASGRIVAVDLAHSWITDADLGRVAELGRLERLDLSGTRISDLGIELLAPLEGVRELKLRFAEFVSEGGVAHLKGWKDLETLDLRGTQVRSLVFEHLAGFPQLRSLDLSHTRITDEGFDRLVELQGLEELAIGSNRLDGAALDYLKLLPKLRTLDLAGVQRVDSGIWGLALNLENLRRLGELRQIESLALGGATITDVGSDRPGRPDAERTALPGLEALGSLVRLRSLDLSRQPAAVDALGFLGELQELRSLNLSQCLDVDDAVIPLLRKLPRLELLFLAGTSLSAQGLSGLPALPSLKYVAAGGSEIPQTAARRFSEANPRIRLGWYEAPFMREKRLAQ